VLLVNFSRFGGTSLVRFVVKKLTTKNTKAAQRDFETISIPKNVRTIPKNTNIENGVLKSAGKIISLCNSAILCVILTQRSAEIFYTCDN
jgi:hypothetical protein